MKKIILLLILILLCTLFSACNILSEESKDNNSSVETLKEETTAKVTAIKSTTAAPTDSDKYETTIEYEKSISNSNIEQSTKNNIAEITLKKVDSGYVGTWSYLSPYGASFELVIYSINDSSITFTLSLASLNAAHIAFTDKITAKISDDYEVYFDYVDSWYNKGSGTLILNGDSIDVVTTVTEYAPNVMYALNGSFTVTR